MKDVVLALTIGGFAGILGGLFGIGGGILIVPALIFVAGYSQQRAQGTSLVALIAPVGLLGLIEYYRRGDADLKVGSLIAVGFLFGALGGAKLAVQLDEIVLRRGFAALLVVVAAYLVF